MSRPHSHHAYPFLPENTRYSPPSYNGAPDAQCVLHRSILDELRLKWEQKLKESGALEPEPAPAPPRYKPGLQLCCMPLHSIAKTAINSPYVSGIRPN